MRKTALRKLELLETEERAYQRKTSVVVGNDSLPLLEGCTCALSRRLKTG